ncbi:MAG TPA: TrkA C-terminal domain-containing protein [Pelomicrobium sp.]|nr:TrkA C-terminal domain-containing protein [Pelomicrobium sp.]
MVAVISLLIVVILSITVTRIATIALAHTGVSREVARFQARSAFTGSGFTTLESERLVNHPVRRRIILALMILGNAGIITAVSSLILTFVRDGGQSLTLKIVLLVVGLAALWALASSAWVDRHLSRLIERALKRYTSLEVRDFASLLNLGGDYRLVELQVERDDWLADKSLRQAELQDEGVLVLGIQRADGTFLGAPHGPTEIAANDLLILYGRTEALERLDERRRGRSGDREHERAVREQRKVAREEERRDSASDG